ncbi:LacI family DNA-binding transcriptional regulator [Nonomuraea sp. KC401]|uniref:LacI family DNA-binding transcriptional regulator n=1 Tax=Nonomuraea sp. KC401 TaxID=1848324 RepID=UPI0010FCF056|nr:MULTISPECIES: LacI family DNA-binding transcriptional regulator [unclassified Nonomuraea]NBE94551.1 substrate-binding domain-containing protein [Nonomuraea sp. K271]TLF76429.1 LacI family DNA-binding transcriptional regulator [Nonomuraea sp. KC401]
MDVAVLAGVSAMTVSRVLNDPDRVRAETRARVLAAVRELDYRPNQAARQLVTGRSGVLGVVSIDTTLYGPATTLYYIEQAARNAGYNVSIASLSSLNRRSMEDGVQRLRAQAVDGVIIVAPHESASEGLRHLPPEMPAVAVDAGDDIPVPVAKVDQRAGAVRVTRHLLSLGHRTVWHVAGPADWLDANGRIEGWRGVLEEAGRPVPDVVRGDWSARSGYRLGRGLAQEPEVTAVFVGNDQMALGVLRALREAGRRVPEDVSVAGFDDIPESAYYWPPLTTVRQDFGEVGRLAFHMLLDRMAGADTDGRRLVEPELVVRESTGAAPGMSVRPA